MMRYCRQSKCGLGKTTLDKISREAGVKLIIPRKKPFWRKGQKQKRINLRVDDYVG
jgi:hypothetical protein